MSAVGTTCPHCRGFFTDISAHNCPIQRRQPSRAVLFVNSELDPIQLVPESCIESAEYIIQCTAKSEILPWTQQEEREPYIYGLFGNGVILNITQHENPPNGGTGLLDFVFTELPNVGEGLILLNKTTKNKPFNMHLGAVVAKGLSHLGETYILISHMFHLKNDYGMEKLITLKITDVNDFRKKTFPNDTASYALGLLRPATL